MSGEVSDPIHEVSHVPSGEDMPASSGGLSAEIGGQARSDMRGKDHIALIGRTKHDLPLYRFRYKGRSEEYVGVMAQDVLAIRPDVVTVDADGFYRVDYALLGIEIVRVN